jgi:hypothetical protein
MKKLQRFLWPSAILSLALSMGLGGFVFYTKYHAMDIEKRLKHLKKELENTRESFNILNAEWAHLSQPKRLEHLQKKYLNLESLSSHQIMSFDDFCRCISDKDEKIPTLNGPSKEQSSPNSKKEEPSPNALESLIQKHRHYKEQSL